MEQADLFLFALSYLNLQQGFNIPNQEEDQSLSLESNGVISVRLQRGATLKSNMNLDAMNQRGLLSR